MPESCVGAKKNPAAVVRACWCCSEEKTGKCFFFFFNTPLPPPLHNPHIFFFPPCLSHPPLLHPIQCFCAVGQSVVRRQRNKVLLCGAAAAACRIKGATSVVFLAQHCSGGVWRTVSSWGRTARHAGVRLLDCKAQGWHALTGQEGERGEGVRWKGK